MYGLVCANATLKSAKKLENYAAFVPSLAYRNGKIVFISSI
jgi:hypothetical protein